jgi:hypothetical protein
MVFRPVDHLGELDDPGSGCPYVVQLRVTGAGGAADRCPRGVPGGRGGQGAGWELDGESPLRPQWAHCPMYVPRPSPGCLEGSRRGGFPLPGRPRGRLHGLRHPRRR